MMMRIEVYGSGAAQGVVLPSRTIVRELDWAMRLIERFNRRQDRRAMNQRAIAIGQVA